MTSRWGEFTLLRYPAQQGHALQAWNAADLLLLEHGAQLEVAAAATLVVNDDFGALSVSLAGCSSWTDSKLAMHAIVKNAERNDGAGPATFIAMSEVPGGKIDLVLLRVPKQLSLLRYQLEILQSSLPAGTPIVCGGMDKHLPTGLADLMEQLLGPVQRLRGSSKARLFTAHIGAVACARSEHWRPFHCTELDCVIASLPNVFSGGQLDIGTRLLLKQITALPNSEHIVDLGCGNGVIGLAAMRQFPAATFGFIDESNLALASALHNVEALYSARRGDCSFDHSDGFLNYSGPPPNLVLCNPPFHQQHVVDEGAGKRLLRQTASALAAGGELWLVANRHLPYQATLQRFFAKVEIVDQDNKFIIWRAAL